MIVLLVVVDPEYGAHLSNQLRSGASCLGIHPLID